MNIGGQQNLFNILDIGVVLTNKIPKGKNLVKDIKLKTVLCTLLKYLQCIIRSCLPKIPYCFSITSVGEPGAGIQTFLEGDGAGAGIINL